MRKRLFAVLLSLAVVFSLVAPVTVTVDAITADTSWYDDGKTEFTLTTAAQLLGFKNLVNEGKTFGGKTVKLGNEIDLNPGWSVDPSAPSAPANAWGITKKFEGTFDGQGYTISGVYAISSVHLGFFWTTTNATVKDLTINNSYFENTSTGNQATGAVVGSMEGGTIENVTLTATVTVTSTAAYWTGGIAGRLQADGCTVRNCTVAATVTGKKRVGGIAGNVNAGGTYTIENCAFTGSATGANNNGVGGIVGSTNNAASTLTITDCYSSGTVTSTTGNTYCGGILGWAAAPAESTLKDGTTVESTLNISYCTVTGTVGAAGDSQNGGIVARNSDTTITIERCAMRATVNGSTNCGQFIGNGGDTETNILNQNYTEISQGALRYAAAYKPANPAIIAAGDFDSEPMDIDSANRMLALAYLSNTASLDSATLNLTKTSYEIMDGNQLWGVAKISKYKNFSGVTLKLTDDINMAGIAFPMIGVGASVDFTGIFDGQNHTISNLSVSGGQYTGMFSGTNSGAQIKNFTLKDATVTGAGEVGAVAGLTRGTTRISNITVDSGCSVTGTSLYVGGIAGRIGHDTQIDQCTVGASVSGTGAVGGMAGCADLLASAGQGIVITNCTVSGDVTGTGDLVGGVIGQLYRYAAPTVTVTNCTVTGAVTGNNIVGGIVGGTTNSWASLTITDCSASTVTGFTSVGGALGRLSDVGSLDITGGTYGFHISGKEYVGGVIGYVLDGGEAEITGSVVSGTIQGGHDSARGVGGVVGRTSGDVTVSGVNCTATVTADDTGKNVYLGGIAGEISGSCTVELSESRFSGSVEFKEGDANVIRIGGLVGVITNATSRLNVENCLMAGSVESAYSVAGAGGILGNCNAQSGEGIAISKTLVTGTVQSSDDNNTGALIGNAANRTVQICDAYYKEGVCGQAIGNNGTVTVSSGYTQVTKENLTGMAALANAPRLFDGGKWCAVNGEICQLIAFRAAGDTAKTAMKVSDISTYRTDSNGDGLYDADFSAIAPDGMVFAGWYSDFELTEMISSDVTSGAAYAVFVDAGALRVWCQYKANEKLDGEKIIMRILTTVPGTDYDSVTFMFAYGGNSKPFTTTHFRKTISGTDVNGDDISYEATAKQPGKEEYYWCGDSMYIGGYNVGVKESLYDTELIITAGWTTNDGTFVTGGSRSVTLRNVSYLAPAS